MSLYMKLSFWCGLMAVCFQCVIAYKFGGDALFLSMVVAFLTYSCGVWVGTDLEKENNQKEVENDLA